MTRRESRDFYFFLSQVIADCRMPDSCNIHKEKAMTNVKFC